VIILQIDSFLSEKFIEKIVKLMKLESNKRRKNGKEKIKLLELDQDSVCSKIFNVYKSIVESKE
jgi:hypothetical protein